VLVRSWTRLPRGETLSPILGMVPANAALTMARMPARIASGSPGLESTTAAKSGVSSPRGPCQVGRGG